MKEIPFSGGRTTPGIVRIGNTVRRPQRTNSEFVRSLLRHLELAGFDGAPRTLGTDERGREVLSYIDGEVPTEIGLYDDDVLIAAAKLIRRYHDSTVALLDTSAAKVTNMEVVCHNDLSPCNFVFRRGLPVAIIDFDAAIPGTRSHDLGYAAWLWLDIGNDAIEAADQRRRILQFAEAYGGTLDAGTIVEAMTKRQRILITEANCAGRVSMARWAKNCLDWTTAHLGPTAPHAAT